MLSFDKNISFVVFLFEMMLASATAAFTHYKETKLVASDKKASAYFGYSVALERNTIVVGANGDDGGGVRVGHRVEHAPYLVNVVRWT